MPYRSVCTPRFTTCSDQSPQVRRMCDMLVFPKKAMPSKFPKEGVFSGFQFMTRFHRILGYSFISNNSVGKPSSRILSSYLLYAVICWIIYLFVYILDIVRVCILLEDERNRFIDRAIQVLGSLRCIGIQFPTILLILIRSRHFVELLSVLQGIEGRLHRSPFLRGVALKVIFLNAVFSVTSVLSLSAEIYGYDEYSAAAYVKILYGVFSLVFGETVSMISFSWLMFFNSVFAAYLNIVNEAINNMTQNTRVDPAKLDELHRLFANVGGAFVLLEDLLGLTILISFPLNIVNAAPWGYYMLKADKGTTIFMLDLVAFMTNCAEMLAAGLYARAPKHEVRQRALEAFIFKSTHTGSVARLLEH